ncbi:MAG TPA: diaminopimelate decarboxylase [Actinomycetota bacterium]|nr:diaminopimelate decarboxylase [Actinomycetota bacterium]
MTWTDFKRVLPDTAEVDADGALHIGGCSTLDLAQRFGTPLLVFDRATFEARARSYAAAAAAPDQVFFAGKSFLCVSICELLKPTGIGLDVCSGGELTTAIAAGFPADRITFHGNNKSFDELVMARDAGVGRVVLDSFEEIERVAAAGLKTKLLLRLTPGVEAHTHEFVQTGQEDSKFGFPLADGIGLEAVKRAMEIDGCELVGFHAHIGSQIFELAAFDLAARRMTSFMADARRECGFTPQELNLGGGLGIAHTEDELTPDPAEAVARITDAVQRELEAAGLPAVRVCFEPGRSIVGASGVTLYTVGTVKRIPGVRTYVSVDGGMSDNIRPALYGARYQAFLADRVLAPHGPRVTVSGKHCESGDVLIRDVHLPDDVTAGDTLCIPATGAYTYSMANNYNRITRPAVVLVHEGNATEIIRRETNEDLLRLDRHLDGSDVGTSGWS